MGGKDALKEISFVMDTSAVRNRNCLLCMRLIFSDVFEMNPRTKLTKRLNRAQTPDRQGLDFLITSAVCIRAWTRHILKK